MSATEKTNPPAINYYWEDLPVGHVIEEADIWARRPGSGEIAAYDFDRVLGKRLTRAVTRNSQLKWSDLA